MATATSRPGGAPRSLISALEGSGRGRVNVSLAYVLALLFYVLPAVMIVYGAFRTSAPGLPGSWSTAGIREGFTDPRTYRTLEHSLLVAVLAGVPGTALAVVFAFVVSRTKAALKRVVTPLMLLVLATPGLFFALSWELLGAPQAGLINQVLAVIGLPGDLVHVNGMWGVAFVLILKICPLAYFMMIGPFKAMDRRLEEASLVSGASRVRTFCRVNLPMMAPAISGALVISLVIGLIAFEIPLIIGVPGGYKVFSTQIYAFINNSTPPDYAGASALAILLIAMVLVLVAVKWRLLDRRSFTTIGGKGADNNPWEIGRWTWLCNACVSVFALLAVVLPTLQLVIGSLEPSFGVTGYYSLANYQSVLQDPVLQPALTNTLLLAAVGGVLAVAVSAGFGIVGRHGGAFARRFLELTTWLPWATYGILLSLGLSWAFLTIPFLRSLFGTVWILLIGLVVAITPLTSRTTDAALVQVAPELEEAARICGASSLRTTVGVVLRLMAPSLLAAWFIGAIHIVGNLEVPILLSTPSNPTVAVQVFQLYQNGDTATAAALFCLVLVIVGGVGALLWACLVLARRFGRRAVTPIRAGHLEGIQPQSQGLEPASAAVQSGAAETTSLTSASGLDLTGAVPSKGKP